MFWLVQWVAVVSRWRASLLPFLVRCGTSSTSVKGRKALWPWAGFELIPGAREASAYTKCTTTSPLHYIYLKFFLWKVPPFSLHTASAGVIVSDIQRFCGNILRKAHIFMNRKLWLNVLFRESHKFCMSVCDKFHILFKWENTCFLSLFISQQENGTWNDQSRLLENSSARRPLRLMFSVAIRCPSNNFTLFFVASNQISALFWLLHRWTAARVRGGWTDFLRPNYSTLRVSISTFFSPKTELGRMYRMYNDFGCQYSSFDRCFCPVRQVCMRHTLPRSVTTKWSQFAPYVLLTTLSLVLYVMSPLVIVLYV